MKKLIIAVLGIVLLASTAYALPGDKQWCGEWDAVPNADGYYIYYRQPLGTWTDQDRVDAGNILWYNLSDLNLTGQWEFCVTAYNADGEGGFSEVQPRFFAPGPAVPATFSIEECVP